MTTEVSTLRSVLHVDMDAFYASIEQRDNPDLRGKPVVVGGDTRGVVAAASYEAREFGIHSAMPMSEARRRCPHLERVKPRMADYRAASKKVFAVFRETTPLVEGLSLDEAFLDVTACVRLLGDPPSIAKTLKARIKERTGLTASVGVAWNKLVAKIASDMEKPDGLVVITPEHCHAKLDPLPVGVIPGIGRETLQKLNAAGIATVGELRCAKEQTIATIFGRFAKKTQARAAGIDDRPVVPERAGKSISAEQTFDRDLAAWPDVEGALLRLTERTGQRLRKASLAAGTVQVKIRASDFSTVTRQRAMHPPGNGTDTIYAIALDLLRQWMRDNPGTRIRLLGVGGSRLSPAAQPDLFAAAIESRPVDDTVDAIRERFGDLSVARARSLPTGRRKR